MAFRELFEVESVSSFEICQPRSSRFSFTLELMALDSLLEPLEKR